MAGPIRIAILADAAQAKREMDGVARSAEGMGASMKTFGKVAGAAVVAGLAVAGGAAVRFGVATVQAASLAEQSLGATETVFGKFADDVIKTSESASNRFGLSANEYRENANLIGALFKNQGVSTDELGGKTEKMIGTAADLAATFGGPTSDAVAALGSAFKGEFDPLEKYGISVKAATINTAAWAIAGVDTKKAFDELTPSQQASAKQMATTDLLMGQATDTVGAFTKEANTLAGQQQRLGANFDNLKVKIGNALLPVVTDLFKALNKDLMPALGKLADKYLPPIADALQGWIDKGGVSKLIDDIGGAVKGVDWDSFSSGMGDASSAMGEIDWGEVSTLIGELADAFQEVSAETAVDTISVFNEIVGFAADHTDELKAALPFLTAAFLAFKGAQVLNQVAGRDSLIGLGLQLIGTRNLTAATRELNTALTNSGGLITTQGTKAATAGGQIQTAGTKTRTMGGFFKTAGTDADSAVGKFSKFGAAAKGAAGIAGLGALAVSATDTSDEVDVLLSTLGGAATGFAVGGPIGAAVGGLAGLFTSLMTSTNDAAAAAENAAPRYAGLRDSLDQTTGAVEENTRAIVYNQLVNDGTMKSLRDSGITRREAVNAILYEGDARAKVNTFVESQKTLYDQEGQQIEDVTAKRTAAAQALTTEWDQRKRLKLADDIKAYDAEIDALEANRAARKKNIDSIEEGIGKADREAKSVRRQAAATRDYTGLLKGLPARARTEIKADGIIPTTKAVAKLAEKYRLNPKQIKTLIKAAGIDATVADVKKVQRSLDDMKNTKADLKKFRSTAMDDIRATKSDVSRGIADMNQKAKAETGKARPNFQPFKTDVSQQLNGIKGTASSGGSAIGSALKSGLVSGVAGAGGLLASSVASAVRQGIDAGKREARIASPSKETEEIGKNLVLGMARGIDKNKNKVIKPLADLTELMLALFPQEIGTVESSVTSAIDGVLTQIDETYTKHAETREKKIHERFERLRKEAKKSAKASAPKQPKTPKGKGDTGDKSARLAADATDKQKKAAADREEKRDKAATAAKEKRDKAFRTRVNQHNNAAEAAQDSLNTKEKRRIRESNDRHKARAKVVKASIAGITDALKLNARAQDQLNAEMETAQGVLTERLEVMRSYAEGVKSSFVDLGNVVGTGLRDIVRTPEQVFAGVEAGQQATSASIIADLKTKVEQARKFADNIRLLTSRGLNDTTLQQMLAAGPEAAGATAQAIADGGQAAVEEIDSLTSDLADQGETLGNQMSAKFYQAGVDSAMATVNGLAAQQAAVVAEGARLANELSLALSQGLGLNEDPKDKNSKAHKTGRAIVDGIGTGVEANYDKLDHMGARMADRLLRAVKDKLGIKSPSKVFKGIGDETTKGLVIGLDEVRVRKAGEQMAAAVVTGYGDPSLSATASFEASGAAGVGGTTVQITVSVPPTADKAAVGREVAKALDAFYRQGGRRAS